MNFIDAWKKAKVGQKIGLRYKRLTGTYVTKTHNIYLDMSDIDQNDLMDDDWELVHTFGLRTIVIENIEFQETDSHIEIFSGQRIFTRSDPKKLLGKKWKITLERNE